MSKKIEKTFNVKKFGDFFFQKCLIFFKKCVTILKITVKKLGFFFAKNSNCMTSIHTRQICNFNKLQNIPSAFLLLEMSKPLKCCMMEIMTAITSPL